MSKIYGVYLAYSKYEIYPSSFTSDPDVPYFPPDLARTRRFDNKTDQLNCYADTNCSIAQTFEVDSEEAFNNKVEEFKKYFSETGPWNANYINRY